MNKKLEDKELVALFQKGNSRAFEILVSRYERHIYNFILTKISDDSIAKDILQETYIKVFTNLTKTDSYRDMGKFKNWMLIIANNLAMDFYRKKTTNFPKQLYFENILEADPIHSPIENDFEIDYLDKINRVKNSIEQLSPRYKEILHLRFEKQMTFREIAEHNGVTVNSALGACRNAILAVRKKV